MVAGPSRHTRGPLGTALQTRRVLFSWRSLAGNQVLPGFMWVKCSPQGARWEVLIEPVHPFACRWSATSHGSGKPGTEKRHRYYRYSGRKYRCLFSVPRREAWSQEPGLFGASVPEWPSPRCKLHGKATEAGRKLSIHRGWKGLGWAHCFSIILWLRPKAGPRLNDLYRSGQAGLPR